jgi:hypothetical protein
MNIERFPRLTDHSVNDKNPAIQLYGRRFYSDQTEIELLAEFILVFSSGKKISGDRFQWEQAFPDSESLAQWPAATPLTYEPSPRLTLKLFAFLGSSKLETRHECHREQFKYVIDGLRKRIKTSRKISDDEVLRLVEQVLVGFVGVAQSRTWCTHTFLPLSPSLLASETIWKQTKAKRETKLKWKDAITNKSMFEHSAHDFMARGGESLFLQLINVFRLAESSEIKKLETDMGHKKGTAAGLAARIGDGLARLLGSMPYLSELTQWIESADVETSNVFLNKKPSSDCGWIPKETWKESYLFGYELANICEAVVDPLEKIEMLKTCCVFQVLRTICAQSVRHANGIPESIRHYGGPNGFVWLVTDPEIQERTLKRAAQRNLTRILQIIFQAIRIIADSDYYKDNEDEPHKMANQADAQSSGLFLKLGKKIGLVTPWKGPSPRFTLTENLLRYLVLAILKPDSRMTLSSFEDNLFKHYGMAIQGKYLDYGVKWSFHDKDVNVTNSDQNWLEKQLKASGFLIPLSDAISLVHNPFAR